MPKVTYFTRTAIAGYVKSRVFYTVSYRRCAQNNVFYSVWAGGGQKKPEGGQEKPEGAGKAIGSILELFRRKNAGFAKQCAPRPQKHDVSRMGVPF